MKINDLFYYDPSSPSGLRWKIDRFNGKTLISKIGDVAGYKNNIGYYNIKFRGNFWISHRVVYEIVMDVEIPKNIQIDHIDRNKQNNNISNLRLVSNAFNSRNKSMWETNSSGKTGVYKWKKIYKKSGKIVYFWQAKCFDLNGKRIRESFSVDKYGDTEAYLLACKSRDTMIEKLNDLGAGYTETHGKEVNE